MQHPTANQSQHAPKIYWRPPICVSLQVVTIHMSKSKKAKAHTSCVHLRNEVREWLIGETLVAHSTPSTVLGRRRRRLLIRRWTVHVRKAAFMVLSLRPTHPSALWLRELPLLLQLRLRLRGLLVGVRSVMRVGGMREAADESSSYERAYALDYREDPEQRNARKMLSCAGLANEVIDRMQTMDVRALESPWSLYGLNGCCTSWNWSSTSMKKNGYDFPCPCLMSKIKRKGGWAPIVKGIHRYRARCMRASHSLRLILTYSSH